MRIIGLEIKNYRNLDGVSLTMAEDCNFIVGENNLGKSNLLALLNTLFSARAFRYEDFGNPESPIEIKIKLKLAPIELGHFEDLFDQTDYSLINIVAKQVDSEESLSFYHLESGTFIPHISVKCINYIYYDSLRNPVSEINFDKGKGVGRFLRNIISKYLIETSLSDAAFLDEDKVTALLQSINTKISKIKSFQEFQIRATHDRDVENLLSKVVTLEDDKGDSLAKAGYGVQFLILVTLSILENLQVVQQRRGDRGIFEDEQTGTNAISLVLGLDEPEIHLHPYMQRSLIKYLNSIVNNTNSDFKLLIKELFDIDSFVGQIIVVTHSPSVVLDNYKQVIRLYRDGNVTKIRSGAAITLTPTQEKHLLMQLAYIKEAFFARCVIFIEGESEFASIPKFADKLGVNFDDLGIAIIQSRGGGGLDPLYDLAVAFSIPVVAVRDKDNNSVLPTKPNFFQTDKRDFDEEIVALIDRNKESTLRELLREFDTQGENIQMQANALNITLSKYGFSLPTFTNAIKVSDIPSHEIDKLKCFYLTWFDKRKSYPLGNLIGQKIPKDDIPQVYQRIILQAKTLSGHV